MKSGGRESAQQGLGSGAGGTDSAGAGCLVCEKE